MNDFYMHDTYWLVTVDGMHRGVFVLEEHARQLFDSLDPIKDGGDVALWRLNGGYLCHPAVQTKLHPENAL